MMKTLIAQSAAEIRMTLRRGETLLLTVLMPLGLLVFFTEVAVIATPDARRIDFLTPGIMSLAVLSTSLVALSISTGFERSYGVLKRLRTTPLPMRTFITAKIVSIVVTELIQIVAIVTVAVLLGWNPHTSASSLALIVLALLLASAACAGIGLFLAGRLAAEINLAAANGLYLILLLGSGMVIPTTSLPGPFSALSHLIPSGALSDILHRATTGRSLTVIDLVSLSVWAIAAPLLAVRTFRVD